MNFLSAIESSKQFRRPDMPTWLTFDKGYVKEIVGAALYLKPLSRTDLLAQDWEVYMADHADFERERKEHERKIKDEKHDERQCEFDF